MKPTSIIRVTFTYEAGQYPEVARRNAGSMLAAAKLVLQTGVLHHKILPEDAMRVRLYVAPKPGELEQDPVALRCADLEHAARIALTHLNETSNRVYRCEVLFAGSQFYIRFSNAQLH